MNAYIKAGKLYYRLFIIYAVARENEHVSFDNFMISNNYHGEGAWRSAIVPSWGQFYKGSYIKGSLIIVGAVVATTGIVLGENMRTYNWQKAQATFKIDARQFYMDRSRKALISRNVSIGFAIALYIYNVLDAGLAPGSPFIKVINFNDNAIQWKPFLQDNNLGLTLTYKFK